MKRILILRACEISNKEKEVIGETKECNNIKIQSELYGFKVDDHCVTTNQELEDILSPKNEDEVSDNEKYDYIYLSSHGGDSGFANKSDGSGNLNYSWSDFGALLCSSQCMKDDCIVMLSCCRGGLNQVAYTLFYCCEKISYIVGPKQSLCASSMLISFNILLYNLEHRGIDPIVACEKIKLATDIRFICFDRLETEAQIDYLHFVGNVLFKNDM